MKMNCLFGIVLVRLGVLVYSQKFTLEVSVTHVPNTGDCVGGNIGLTGTSVQVQYREITDGGETNWKTIVAESQSMSSMQNMNFNGVALGVQFRVLQLEHGGGVCNCWDLQGTANTSNTTISLLTNPCSVRYCGGSASDARGVITEALYFTGSSGNRCPWNSDSTLISNKGPAITKDCSIITPRM